MKNLFRLLLILLVCTAEVLCQSLAGTPVVATGSGQFSYTVISISNVLNVCFSNGAGETNQTPCARATAGTCTASAFPFTLVGSGWASGSTTLDCWTATPTATGPWLITTDSQFSDTGDGVIFEVAGTTTTIDAFLASASTGSTQNPSLTALTTTNTDFMLGIVRGGSDYSPGTGWTAVTTASNYCTTSGACIVYKASVAAGSNAVNFNGTAAAAWVGGSYAIKQSGGGGGGSSGFPGSTR